MSAFMDIPKSNYAVSYERLFLCSTAATARLVYNILNEETDISFFSLFFSDRKDRTTGEFLFSCSCEAVEFARGLRSTALLTPRVSACSDSSLLSALCSRREKPELQEEDEDTFWVKEAKCWGSVSVNAPWQQERANADATRWKNVKEGQPRQQHIHQLVRKLTQNGRMSFRLVLMRSLKLCMPLAPIKLLYFASRRSAIWIPVKARIKADFPQQLQLWAAGGKQKNSVWLCSSILNLYVSKILWSLKTDLSGLLHIPI